MSYYYNYFLGYIKDNKVYPLGPFDNKGKIHAIISRSRSFASDLHDDFLPIDEELLSDELKEQFQYKNYNGDIVTEHIKCLPIDKLGNDNYIKSGYFLIEDIEEYQKDKNTEDIFYEAMTPELYAMKMKNELAFGTPKEKFDAEENPLDVHSCSEYAYFAYPNYLSREYEVSRIKDYASIFEYADVIEDAELVALETEG